MSNVSLTVRFLEEVRENEELGIRAETKMRRVAVEKRVYINWNVGRGEVEI
jgi:hypothetical protein